MEMPDRDQEENLLAAALLLLWIAFARASNKGTSTYKLFRQQFDDKVTPILQRLYGTARTTLGRQFGVAYEEVSRSDGSKATRVPRMNTRIDEYADRLWEIFQKRFDSDQAKKAEGEEVKEFERGDADRISATELSKLQSAAEIDAEDDVFRFAGKRLVAVWIAESTACDICSPLHGTTKLWRLRFPQGPGSTHPFCRCSLEWREIV